MQKYSEIKCPNCGSIFQRKASLTQALLSQENKITCCSRSCANQIQRKKLGESERKKISHQSLIRIFYK